MQLDDKKWKEFNLIGNDLFYIDLVKTLKSTSIVGETGIHDVVGATSKNNGNIGFLDYKYNDLLCNGNCICLIKTGEGSVGEAVYKQNDFIPSNNVCVIRNKYLNKYNALFIVNEINKQSDRYNYGYIRNNARIHQEKIMLPINAEAAPDYEFMEKYIKNILFEQISILKEYCINSISSINNQDIPKLPEKNWRVFNVSNIFSSIKRGKRLKKGDHKSGNVPYVSSTMMNNGVDNFICNREGKRFNNCITIANSGSVGASFYHQYEFIGSDHITTFKNDRFNKYIYLFLTTVVSRIGDKYSFNREINDFRISKEKILLPVDKDDNPDYEYMEQYIKNIMFEQYSRYLQFLED